MDIYRPPVSFIKKKKKNLIVIILLKTIFYYLGIPLQESASVPVSTTDVGVHGRTVASPRPDTSQPSTSQATPNQASNTNGKNFFKFLLYFIYFFLFNRTTKSKATNV